MISMMSSLPLAVGELPVPLLLATTSQGQRSSKCVLVHLNSNDVMIVRSMLISNDVIMMSSL